MALAVEAQYVGATHDARSARATAVMLIDEYKSQFAWRSWPVVFDLLPPLHGATVLDLGCALGDQAAALAARGARVIGVDSDPLLLAHAQARHIPGAQFLLGDLNSLPDVGPPLDGIWCSFATAYLPNLEPSLASWAKRLKPTGWLALTEIDDLFGHEPIQPSTRQLLADYADSACAADGYDFFMGRRLRAHVENAGFHVYNELTLPDLEFSFLGPAEPPVREAWSARFQRMNGLQHFCGPRFDEVRTDFLTALAHPEHRSHSKVICCLATF